MMRLTALVAIVCMLCLAAPARADVVGESGSQAVADPGPLAAQPAGNDVVMEILKVLRDSGDISEARYQQLMQLAGKQAPAAPLAAAVEPKPGDFRVFWKDGPRFETNDKKIKLQLNGRIHNHYGFIHGSDNLDDAFASDDDDGDIDNFRAFFRRVRLGVSGKLYDRFGFKTEYEFAGGDVDFADVYVEAYKVPLLGTVTVGHFKEPLSIDEMTSTNNNWFIERSQVNEAFYDSRNTGVQFRNNWLDRRLTFTVAGQQDTGGNPEDGDGGFDGDSYRVATRLTGLPYVDDDGNVVHLGFSYRHRFFADDDGSTERFRARPETRVTNFRFVDTGNLDLESSDLFVGELAAAFGPLNVVAEYFGTSAKFDNDPGSSATMSDDAYFDGYYAQASYFLTGDKRPYNRTRGGFGSVNVKRPLFTADGKGEGYGAVELLARFSHLDLNDEDIEGGEQDLFTFGVNWWPLNPFRFMFNYTYANVDDATENGIDLDNESAHIYQSRFQVDF